MVSEPGRKANERAEAIERRSVSGEEYWDGQNPHSGSAERPERAALPPPRGQGDLRLTRRGRRVRISGEGEAQNGNSGSEEKTVLWTIFVILLVLWLLGLITSYTIGGFIHILLVVAIVVLVIRLVQGRRVI